jgi:Ca2+/H+ antiporter, TMEM165/GDT1 family
MIDQSTILLFITVAVASAVEATEALTILLASGITRGWRSTFEGALLALACLAIIVIAVGTALINYVPLNILRTVVGTLLLIFGLQWLTKAVLRQTGFKASHDEHDIHEKQVAVLSKDAGIRGKRDSMAFAVSFKGVLLEGMEVVMIVISFGLATKSGNQLVTSELGALVGVVIMVAVAAVVAKPLAKVPENYMKLGVGILLTVFGMFWMGEGVGVQWPFGDPFILVLLAIVFLATLGLIAYFKRVHKAEAEDSPK